MILPSYMETCWNFDYNYTEFVFDYIFFRNLLNPNLKQHILKQVPVDLIMNLTVLKSKTNKSQPCLLKNKLKQNKTNKKEEENICHIFGDNNNF